MILMDVNILVAGQSLPVLDTGDWPESSAKDGIHATGFRTIHVRNDNPSESC